MAITRLQDLSALPTRVKFDKPTNSTLHHEPAAATDAVNTLSASDTTADEAWVLREVAWSYDLTPSGGSLTISDGTLTWKLDITGAGPNSFQFDPPVKFAADTTVTITLASGGTGVSGVLSTIGSCWIEKAQ